ncbi:MAG: DNA mismatch repair protein MutS [Clostridia bacterium]|nr:DNA mismatch repair protein MutS [Clostridia bacterium]
MSEISPMMKQYFLTKEQYKDCVLFYRLGDFYEMFFDDAIRVSKLLDLTLTSRNCGDGKKAPMCGVPHHAADVYIAKLVSMGEKVAVCEQFERFEKNKKGSDVKVVDRDVVKVVSAGTITENTLLNDKQNNFICAISKIGDNFAVSWADITTGEFYTESIEKVTDLSVVTDYVSKIEPVQIICPQSVYLDFKDVNAVKHGAITKLEIYKEWAFNPTHAEKTLKDHFSILSLDCFGIQNDQAVISCCGALIEYLRETQKHALINVNKIQLLQPSEYLLLDSVAVKNLELVKSMRDGKRYGTLLSVLDKTETPMGSRNLYSWILNPLIDENKINYRLDAVEEIYNDNLLRNALTDVLSEIRDTERLAGKVSNGNITPKDALNLSKSLELLPTLKFTLSGTVCKPLRDVYDNVYDFSSVTSLISHALNDEISLSALKDGGFVKEGFDRELDRLRDIAENSTTLLKELEEREKQATGIRTLKVGYNKVFGYYIEVSKSFKDKVPYSYVRKQTLTGGERFITEELKNLEEDILTSREKSLKIELEIFAKIKNLLAEHILHIQRSSKAVAFLDCVNSLAIVAKKYGYVRPKIAKAGSELIINGGRHPIVENVSNSQFIPNDTRLHSNGDRMMIITGPNMAGKSTYMRQVALITIMAHMGSFVPAKECQVPITDKIFTRVGASDNLVFDQSTFMVEMNEVASILNKATKNSLIILDEVGRGTSTYDGLSIAWAVVEYVCSEIKANTLFATHYHELSELEGKLEGVKNYKILVKEYNGDIIFLRKIQEGSANKSFGIEVASLAGVPKCVTSRAKKILKQLESSDINSGTAQDSGEDIVDNEIILEIKNLDVNSLSPIEALNYLNGLKNKIGD